MFYKFYEYFIQRVLKMTSIFSSKEGCLVNHAEYINKLYHNVYDDSSIQYTFNLKPILFDIRRRKDVNKRIKRKKKNDESAERHENFEMCSLECKFNDLQAKLPLELKSRFKNADNGHISAHDAATKVIKLTTDLRECGFSGGNNSPVALLRTIGGLPILIPPFCRFLTGNISEQVQKLTQDKFDIIIADPPWWNKYIRRVKSANPDISYSMMYNEEIAAIPMQSLFGDNALVAMWCTNSASNIAAVRDIIFPAWSVEYVTTWWWMKVTIDLQPVCDFSWGTGKKPYERIIIGKRGVLKKGIEMDKLILSVPSAIHSHKPPLYDLLRGYLDSEQPKALELFARYLLPHTTSVGFEPLRWQHTSLYDRIEKGTNDDINIQL